MPESKTTKSSSQDAEEGEGSGAQLTRRPRGQEPEDRLSAGLRAVRERLARGVLITAERLQEAVDDAVHNKLIDRHHAEELLARLVVGAREQTRDLLTEIEHLVSRGRRAPVLPTPFPISGYDDLNAKQVIAHLHELDESALLQVRTHEAEHANRKTVLAAIERSLK